MSNPFKPLPLSLDSCWQWPGSLISTGYAQVRVDGHLEYVHRIAYEAAVGPIPDGYEIDHLCHNRWCFNPSHLEVVTHAENMRRNRPPSRCINGHDTSNPNNIQVGKRGARICVLCPR